MAGWAQPWCHLCKQAFPGSRALISATFAIPPAPTSVALKAYNAHNSSNSGSSPYAGMVVMGGYVDETGAWLFIG